MNGGSSAAVRRMFVNINLWFSDNPLYSMHNLAKMSD